MWFFIIVALGIVVYIIVTVTTSNDESGNNEDIVNDSAIDMIMIQMEKFYSYKLESRITLYVTREVIRVLYFVTDYRGPVGIYNLKNDMPERAAEFDEILEKQCPGIMSIKYLLKDCNEKYEFDYKGQAEYYSLCGDITKRYSNIPAYVAEIERRCEEKGYNYSEQKSSNIETRLQFTIKE